MHRDRYDVVLKLKANGLLMDEQTMKFYSQVLNITPEGDKNVHRQATLYVYYLLRFFEKYKGFLKKREGLS